MATTHREEPSQEDSICVDCEMFYECSMRENMEAQGNRIVECLRYKRRKEGKMNKISEEQAIKVREKAIEPAFEACKKATKQAQEACKKTIEELKKGESHANH